MNGRTQWTICLVALACLGHGSDGHATSPRPVVNQPDPASVARQGLPDQLYIRPVEPPPVSHVIVAELTVADDGLALRDARVLPGAAPNRVADPDMLQITLRGPGGQSLYAAPLWDPRWIFVWDDEWQRDALSIAPRATVPVLVPFDPRAAELVVEQQGGATASLDLAPAISRFCAESVEAGLCNRSADPKESAVTRPEGISDKAQ